MTTKVAIIGASGRMGRNLITAAHQHEQVTLVGASVRANSAFAHIDIGEIAGIGTINNKAQTTLKALSDAQVFIDFTSIESTLDNVKWCQQHNKAIVIGTTGFETEHLAQIKKAAKTIPIIVAPNTSLGVNLLFKLVELTAKAIGDYTDIEILEAHHRFKKDAPSGTAVKIGEVIAEALGRNLTECAVYGREGIGEERDANCIGFATVRAGDIIGEHTALFADLGERLEITHKATSRMTFANGAIKAAQWLAEQPAGFYSMQDVLSL